MPLMSHEVRWFFPGPLSHFPELQAFITSATPFARDGNVPPPAPTDRLDGAPDVYLVVPGAQDLGVKWREGQLQIKGRLSSGGLHRFAGRFFGVVEHWGKWSYKGGALTAALGPIFAESAQQSWQAVAVRKTRTLRKIHFGARHTHVEVAPDTSVDRGLGVELTDLAIDGQRYCSLGFEAFPNDTELLEQFLEVTEKWLEQLTDASVVLAEHQSMSYPEFLVKRAGFSAGASL